MNHLCQACTTCTFSRHTNMIAHLHSAKNTHTHTQADGDPGEPSGLEQEQSQSFPLEDITVKY